ncbi:MAG TPA: imidazole glycerol phosphate synthase subunit HisH [Candidatus Bathyarchaeota archaeon]|nr:imidazole glycerol phosphate synthase subunit HisH [Candidatus Bathyarchaeota archaeon]
MPKVAVVNYGVGNLRSIKRGLEKAGADVEITHNPKKLRNSDAIVLPGVGAFAPAVKNMSPITDVANEAMKDGKPIFGVCLGLQLLFTRSSEGGSTRGLDYISGDIVKLPETVKTPQMGWNTLNIVQAHPLLEGIKDGSYVYFVHSYYPQPTESDVIVATTEYGVKFPSMVAKGNLFATQFHPEKSSKTGLTILKNFVRIVKR